jgi:hypothetical protein
LAVLLLVLQGVCWLLARGLGLSLRWQPVALGLALPLLVVAPWLSRSQLLAPCNILRELPDAVRNRTDLAALLKPDPYDGLNDVMYQLLPWELEVRHALAERRLPFWSDLLDGGSNLWANPQAGVLSPLALPARAVPIQHHLLAALALKLLLCCEGTWLLCRRLGRSRAASAVAAGAFTLGGGVMGWAMFPISSTLAWVPWLTAGVIGLFRQPRPRVVATTAVLTAALLVSGHPETAAIGGLFAALCGLWLRRRRAGLRRPLLAASSAALLGFGLAAPHVLPFLSILPESQRAHETLAEPAPTDGLQLHDPRTWLRARDANFVVSPANPHAYGRPYRDPFRGPYTWPEAVSGYVGLLAFAGAIVALFAVRDRRAAPFLAFAAASLLITARWLPFVELTHAVPWLRLLAHSRFLPVGSLALAAGAAFGIDGMLSRARRWWTWACLAVAAALSLAVEADGWALMLWALAAGVLLLARWSRPAAGAAAAAVLLLDLVPWSHALLPSCVPDFFYPRTRYLEVMARETGGPANGRATGARQLLFPSILPAYGIAEIRPHNPLAPMSHLRVLDAAFGFAPTRQHYFPPLGNLDHPLLDFLAVRAVAGSLEVPPPETLERIDGGRFGLYHLYRNPDALPRWFLAERMTVIDRRDLRRWLAAMSDPREVAVFGDELPRGWRPDEHGAVRAISTSPGRLRFTVPAAGEKLLVTSIPAARGWRARSGERGLDLVTVDGAFVGVVVPSGVSRVALTFRPPGLRLGALLCLLAAGVTAALAAPARSRRRGAPGRAPRGRSRRRTAGADRGAGA